VQLESNIRHCDRH